MSQKIILDVRTPEEYAQEHILDSIDIPLSFIETRENRVAKLLKGKEVLVICRSGRRAQLAKDILSPYTDIEALTVFPGGILEYKKQFPEEIEVGKLSRSIPIMRQVQIVAGGLVLIFSILGFLTDKNFFFGTLFVGAGLFYAGFSGNCIMASLLKKLPFNI